MKRVVEEQLSAFIDDELPPEEMELLLRRLQADPDLRRTMERYVLVSSLTRGDAVGLPSLHGRIGEALRDESPLPAPATPLWFTPVGRGVIGTAVAAGVAALALLTLDFGLQPDADLPALAGNQNAVEPVIYTVPASVTNTLVIPAARLTNYLVAHGEYATTFSRNAMDSRIVRKESVDEVAEDDPEQTED